MLHGNKMFWAVLAIFILAFMPACGGGGGNSATSGASVTGLWYGTSVSTNGQITNVYGYASTDNEMRLFSDDLNIQYSGQVSVSGNKGNGKLTGYVEDGVFYNGEKITSYSISFTVEERVSIVGTYTTQGDSGSFTLSYDPGAERQSSLLDLEGNWGYSYGEYWAHAIIDGNGQLNATGDSGCEVSGPVTLPSYDWSIYRASVNVSLCGDLDGTYSGLMAMVQVGEEDDGLFMIFSNNTFSYMDVLYRLP